MKALLPLIFLLLTSLVLSAQTVVGIEPISSKEVRPWIVKVPSAYSGTYHFGFSECESTFELQIKKGAISASKTYTQIPSMRLVTKKFSNVRIIGNKFYSDQGNGEFVVGDLDESSGHGLKIYKSWSCSTPKGKAEIGPRYD